MSRTPFTETELLLAIMEDDRPAAAVIAQGMHPGERMTLRRAMIAAIDLLRRADYDNWTDDEWAALQAAPK